MIRYLFLLLTFFIATVAISLFAGNSEELLELITNGGITADLRDPFYSDGVLSTTEGGVISAPGIRIQAKLLRYTHKTIEEKFIHSVEAEGNIIISFNQYILIGQSLFYDFESHYGILINGKSGMPPWYFGAQEIHLLPNGNFSMRNAYITTSDKQETEWRITATHSYLTRNNDLKLRNIQIKFGEIPLFWLPRFNLNFKSIFDSPVRYTLRWGGRQGPRIGFVYEIIDWEAFKAFLRMDYRLERGFGGGLETKYKSPSRLTYFETINYYAHDVLITEPKERDRYRFQGKYRSYLESLGTKIELSYDKLSDQNMPTDYNDKTLRISNVDRTQLHIRHVNPQCITQGFLRPRINSFQTLKQELPTLGLNIHPQTVWNTGIISDTILRTSYLDFEYSRDLCNVKDYNSTRVEYFQNFYRPFKNRFFQFTPEASLITIFYSNAPHNRDRVWLVTGRFIGQLNTSLTKCYDQTKHVIEPYLRYEYIPYPTSAPNKHHIFDIEDGWFRLNQLSFGFNQNFYVKSFDGFIHRLLNIDLYTYAFFDTPTIPGISPRLYSKILFSPTRTVQHTLNTGWNFFKNQLDFINYNIQWTVSQQLALALEYRHRSSWYWRKVDRDNFILDSFRNVEQLRESELSDRRDTLLYHLYYMFRPTWALEVSSRQGWNRRKRPNYLEYQIDLNGLIRTAWRVKISYQHKEFEDRFAFYFSLDLPCPKSCYDPCAPPRILF